MIRRVIGIDGLSREADERRRRAGRRQCRAIKVGGQKRIDRTAQGTCWTNEARGKTSEHFCPIERERLWTEIRRPRRIKDVHAHVIGVRPDAQMRVIEEIRAEMKTVAEIGAGGVAGG